ncbi:MAG: PAS domain S-box protein [Candidatus Fermentibacteria bacterium]|nr:PAS domain S-box protein [Candidatus Fermentibacteria bacterium]
MNLFRQMGDSVVFLNDEFCIEFANPSFLSLIKADSMEAISGLQFSEFAATDQDKILLEEQHTDSSIQVSLSTTGKEVIPVDVSFSPIVDEQGLLSGYIAVVRDITGYRNKMDSLKNAGDKYKDIVLSGFDWVWEVDTSGTFTFLSSSVQQGMGYSSEELFGKTPFDHMTAEEGERVVSVFTRISSRNESFHNLVNHCIAKDGKEVIVATSGVPVFDNDGKLKGYRGGDRIITDEVKTAEALKKAVSVTNKILEGLPVGVVLVDGKKHIRQINDRACEVIGRKRDELVGQLCHSAFCPSLVDQCPILDRDMQVDRAKHFVIHKDGHKIPVVKSVIPVHLFGEDLLLEAFIDISEMQGFKNDLDQTNKELAREVENYRRNTETARVRNKEAMKQRAVFVKDKIAALGGITGIVELLLETDQTAEQREMLTIVQAYCRKMTNAVHLMQDKMGSSRGGISLERNEFLIRKLLRLTVEPLQDMNMDIKVKIDPMLPGLFYGPVAGLRNALQILLEIAVVELSGNAVEIGVTSILSKESVMEVRFSVSFPGAEQAPDGSLHPLADSVSSEVDSRLKVCSEFAKAVGGELDRRIVPGKGCAYWLTIPLEKRISPDVIDDIVLTDVHVLIIEKDSQLRRVYFKMLHGIGCCVTAVADRSEALTGLRESNRCDSPFQIAILDGDSPDRDAALTAKLITLNTVTEGRMQLILCSSRLRAGDIDSYYSEGFSAVLRKPLNLSTLRNCLLKLLGSTGENLPVITEYSLP